MNHLENYNRPARPNSYLALAIISTLACCMPLGIVSIVYATKVNTAYDDGDYALAEKFSKNAKHWGIASVVGIVVIFAIALFTFLIIGISGGFDT